MTATATVPAAAPRIYALIADYHDGHRRIVPPRYFQWLHVERGGVGAGTRVRFAMRIFGSTREFRAAISEPEPGRVLVETDVDTGAITTFVVRPRSNGEACEVTISTELAMRDGIGGRLERWVTTKFLGSVYRAELLRVAECARGGTVAAVPSAPGA